MEQSKFNEVINSALGNVKAMADGNTVLGEPIETAGGIVIIPVSKIGVGLAISGLDYASKKESAKNNNFGGAGGTGITVSPVAFLVVHPEGRVEILDLKNGTQPDTWTTINSIVDNGPKLYDKIKALFAKYSKKNEENKEESKASTNE